MIPINKKINAAEFVKLIYYAVEAKLKTKNLIIQLGSGNNEHIAITDDSISYCDFVFNAGQLGIWLEI